MKTTTAKSSASETRSLLKALNKAYANGPDAQEKRWLRRVRDMHRRLVKEDWTQP